MFAPFAFRNVLERAITAEDYATLAADNERRLAERSSLIAAASGVAPPSMPPVHQPHDPRAAIEEESGEPGSLGAETCLIPFQRLQGARGTLRWNGSWYEVLVAIDPQGTEDPDAELLEEVDAYLEPFRRIGHDVDVRRAQYVPIELALSVCVNPQFQRGHVEAALLDVFGNRMLPDGTLGFFHPDNLTFAQNIYVSRVIATAQAVPRGGGSACESIGSIRPVARRAAAQ
jgi:hypothetical protein